MTRLLWIAILSGVLQAQPRINTVVNLVGGTALSPGAFAVARGTGFGPTPRVLVGGAQVATYTPSDTSVFFQIPKSVPAAANSVAIQSDAGTSAAFALTLTPTSPVILQYSLAQPPAYFFDPFPTFTRVPTPSPGDRLFISVDGYGTSAPPDTFQVLIDEQEVPVIIATTSSFGLGSLTARVDVGAYQIQIPRLPGGPHKLAVAARGALSPAVSFNIIATGMFLSQTGLTLTGLQGGPQPPSQSFSILSGAGTLNYTLSSATLSGGAWLSATPTSGSVNALLNTGFITVRANQSGLAAGTYYGAVTVTSRDVPNSPQVVTVVLNVPAAGTRLGPSLDKTGLIFIGPTGGTAPGAQTLNIFNPVATSVNLTSATFTGTGSAAFRVTPSSGTLAPGTTLAISVSAVTTGLTAGFSNVRLTLAFSDGTTRTVSLLLVIAQGASPSGRNADEVCKPSRLLPVFTLPGDSFTIPAAWPTPIEISIVNDCGAAVNSGTVTVTFSNGDPPLRLTSALSGKWSATWPPSNPRASGINILVTATQNEANLTGTAQISGGVNPNPTVPEISPGGVVETASYSSPVAPGNLVAIFGTKLAPELAQATRVPLPTELGSITVLVGGRPIPLYFVSDGQLVGVIPYDLATNTQYPVIVQRGSAISVPQNVLVGVARPAIFSTDSSGQGQGHIYKFTSAGAQVLADRSNRAKTGDVLVIYCSGLGAVGVAVTAGSPAPLDRLAPTAAELTALIGGIPARVDFAGLTPGSTALYQVNLVVPAGVVNGDAVPVVLSIAGQDSSPVTFALQN